DGSSMALYVIRVRRRVLLLCDHHVLALLGAYRRRPPWARVIGQPVEAELDEPGPPLAHRLLADPLPGRDRRVVQTLRATQHDPRPQRQRLRRATPLRPPAQLITLVIGQLQHGLRASRTRHTSFYDLYGELLGARR